jgi:hypothetical protein
MARLHSRRDWETAVVEDEVANHGDIRLDFNALMNFNCNGEKASEEVESSGQIIGRFRA